MEAKRPVIDAALVRHLVAAQFSHWADLPVSPVLPGGWDNRLFHLGEQLVVRMPSASVYAAQVEKEHAWLPQLAPFLPLSIPVPLAIGEPAKDYPWRWSIYKWIDGDAATLARISELRDFATALAQFLIALQRINPIGGPSPGPHNFHRGGSLAVYDAETRHAIAVLAGKIDTDAATGVWETALATTWQKLPVWIHGDVSADNLLVQGGQLASVIDFGMLGVGDPACDLSIAWTLFEGESREVFRSFLPLDVGTWARGRAWTLWKALIVASDVAPASASWAAQCWRIIENVLSDHRRMASNHAAA